MSTLERAIAIAAEGHAGQVDKAGAPYVLHPLRLMLAVKTSDERIVAVLHDVVEDCPGWTFDRLRGEGFSDEVITALQAVTKREGESYEGFVLRAAANPIGRQVKLADLHDNCDLSRIAAPTPRDLERIEKYRRAIEIIEPKLEVWNLDDSPESADWTKQSWDLPPYKSKEFFDVVGIEQLDSFRQLPVYRYAVENLLIHDDEWVGDYVENWPPEGAANT